MNLFEEDTISVQGKKQASEHIIKRYGDFGWQLTEKKDDKLYGDVVHMKFTRPHFIENKDELQLLQVRLEIAYNKTGKLARKSTARTAVLSTVSAILAAAFAAGGIVLILLLGGLIPLICGSVLCAVGAVIAVVGGIFSHRVYKKDKTKFALLIEKEVEKIENLCKCAKELRGEHE